MFEEEVDALVENYLGVCSEGTRQTKLLLNMSFHMPHGQFLDEYLRRQRIALASWDHQEARPFIARNAKVIFQLESPVLRQRKQR